MTKQELIERVYRMKGLPPGITKKALCQIIEATFGELGDYFVKSKVTRAQGARFTYPGFGTFTKRKRGERRGRNPRTGDKITIPSSFTISFNPSQDLKSSLNRK
ncbi:MAG: HU family DNA-binding protein [Deltaproteobacteria bacterium]|nr:HU family DNA-binding protein [Deltaproteobacteria bacterium]